METATTVPLEETQPETTVPVVSEKPITSASSVKNEEPTGLSSDKESSEISPQPSIETPPGGNQNSSVSENIDEKNNSSEVVQTVQNARMNTKLPRSSESEEENL